MFDPNAMNMQDLTTDDVSRINKAMKTEQFGNLMQDYLDEISDPKNRDEYDQYMEQLEEKGEMPDGMELLRCEPGFCVKTEVQFKNGQTQKCYINVCYSNLLKDVEMVQTEGGSQVSLPYSLSPPRVDQDSKKATCLTCDFGVSENSFAQCKQNPDFLRMIVDIATKNLSQNFLKGFEEVKNDFKVMKKIQCKGGKPYMMSVRTADLKQEKRKKKKKKASDPKNDGITPGELKEMKKDATKRLKNMMDDDDDSGDEEKDEKDAPEEQTKKIRVPQHSLIHQGELDFLEFDSIQKGLSQQTIPPRIPRNLKLVVKLPGINSASEIELDVQADNIVLETQYFYLDLPLPYVILPDDGSAKFDKPKKELQLVLPVAVNEENLKRAQPVSTESLSNYEKYGIGAVDGDDDIVKSDDEDSLDGLPPLPKEEEDKEDESGGNKTADDGEGAAASSASSSTTAEGSSAGNAGRDGESKTSSSSSSSSTSTPSKPKKDADDEITYVSPRNKSLTAVEEFIPARGYSGSRPGYYFGTGRKGTGYYRDLVQGDGVGSVGKTAKKEVLFKPESRTGREVDAGGNKSSSSGGTTKDEFLVEEIEDGSSTIAASSGDKSKTGSSSSSSGGSKSSGVEKKRSLADENAVLLKDIKPEYCFHSTIKQNLFAGGVKSSTSSSTSSADDAKEAHLHHDSSSPSYQEIKDDFHHLETKTHLILILPPPAEQQNVEGTTIDIEIENASSRILEFCPPNEESAGQLSAQASKIHLKIRVFDVQQHHDDLGGDRSSTTSLQRPKICYFHKNLSRPFLKYKPQQHFHWYRTEHGLVCLFEKEDVGEIVSDRKSALSFTETEEKEKTWLQILIKQNQEGKTKEGQVDKTSGEQDTLLPGEEEESAGKDDTTAKVFLRSEEGDTTMGHAVLLKNRLFFELM
ncbi:unnamed protein product [Amoebophrya sp. A120]|nr:unnamed protein product [Amoebophrya sp. A120]|eukprot:GSA120T00014730001.1